MRSPYLRAVLAGIAAIPCGSTANAADLGTAFTYQGSLEKPAGTPVTATCNFEFGLWDAPGSGSPPTGGNQIGTTQTVTGVLVASGVFTVSSPDIDFGDTAFDGTGRWLEIHVKCPPDVVFTALAPRVELTPAPYALWAAHGVGPPGVLEVTPTGELNLTKDLGAGMANHLLFDANNWTMTALSDTGAAPLTIESRASSGDRMQLILDGASYSATIAGQPPPPNTAGITPPPKLRVSLVGATANTAAADAYVSIAAYDADDVTPVLLRLKSGETNVLNITTTARVGIGTDTPGEILDVTGNIHASGTITSGSTITINGTSGSENISSSASLDLRTAAGRTLRLQLEGGATIPSIIGGYSGNIVSGVVNGATISGGGGPGSENRAENSYVTISGGANNTASGFNSTIGGGSTNASGGNYATISGGTVNMASGVHSTVGGGNSNYAGSLCLGGVSNGLPCVLDADCLAGTCPTAEYSTVGGGVGNKAGRYSDTVGGGYFNRATGGSSAVGGGEINISRGSHSTVPGGRSNQAGGDYSFAAGRLAIVRNGDSGSPYYSGDAGGDEGTFIWADASVADFVSTGPSQFLVRASGGTKIYSNSTATVGVELASGGNSWSALSDRNIKENVTPLDRRDVLERLHGVPVTMWNLKSQVPSILHIGPMAQDFHAAFGLGERETHISSSDADGVALAAIQGLYEIVMEKDCEIEELRSEIEKLKEAMDRRP